MIIDIVRHGQTDWNVERRIQGNTDIDLNATGIMQAESLANRLQDECYDYIVSSILKRAYNTANIIRDKQVEKARNEGRQLPRFITNPLLGEKKLGEIEGKTRQEIDWEKIPRIDQEPIPNGSETREGFKARVKQGIDDILPEVKDGKTLIVSHRGTIRTIIHHLTGTPVHEIEPVKNTAYYRLEKQGSLYVPIIESDISHLDKKIA